jgi:hypothetical protein
MRPHAWVCSGEQTQPAKGGYPGHRATPTGDVIHGTSASKGVVVWAQLGSDTVDWHNLGGWLGRQESNLGMAESKSAALPLGYAPTGIAFYAQPRGVSRRANPSPTGERGVNIGAKSNTSMTPLAINVSTTVDFRNLGLQRLLTTCDIEMGPTRLLDRAFVRSCVRSAIARRQIRADLAARANLAAATFDRVAWPVRCPAPRCRCGAAHRAPSYWKARRRPWLSPRAPGSAALGVNAIASARANRLAAGAQPLLLSNFFQLHPSNFAHAVATPCHSAGLTATWLRGCRRCGGPNLPRICLQIRPERNWPIFRGPGRRCCEDRAESAPMAVAA